MGRVFSYEAVASGRVPQPEDFANASKMFGEQIQAGIDNGTIDGGFVFGSTARGTANLRSDFDTLIALSDGSDRSYIAARDITQTIAHEFDGRILIEPICYPKQTLANGTHELNRLFGRHLIGSIRVVEGSDPAQYMTFPEQESRDIFISYVYQKARKLTNSYVKLNVQNPGDNGLQRMLELPNSLGRKTVHVLEDSGYLPDLTEASDKPAVFQQCSQLFKQHGIDGPYGALVAADTEYTEALQQAVDGEIDKETYDDVMRGLHSKMPLAIEWTRQVGAKILPLLDTKS